MKCILNSRTRCASAGYVAHNFESLRAVCNYSCIMRRTTALSITDPHQDDVSVNSTPLPLDLDRAKMSPTRSPKVNDTRRRTEKLALLVSSDDVVIVVMVTPTIQSDNVSGVGRSIYCVWVGVLLGDQATDRFEIVRQKLEKLKIGVGEHSYESTKMSCHVTYRRVTWHIAEWGLGIELLAIFSTR